MDSQPARLPQDLLRSLIIPGLAPAPADNQPEHSFRTESWHHSHLAGSSFSEHQDRTTQAPKTNIQEQPSKKHTMAEMDVDFDFDLEPLGPILHTPAAEIKKMPI
jgi:hypothetical protein